MDDRISLELDNRGIKIAWVNSIHITKSINLQLFTLILYGVDVRCDVDIYKLTASAQSIYKEVHAQGNARRQESSEERKYVQVSGE